MEKKQGTLGRNWPWTGVSRGGVGLCGLNKWKFCFVGGVIENNKGGTLKLPSFHSKGVRELTLCRIEG